MAATFPTVRYFPAHELRGRPCIVVDGRAFPEARITLSHWPGSGTPCVWHFEGVSGLTPRLYMQQAEASRLLPETFRQRLQDFLATAPAAWNPYVAPGVTP